MFKGNVCHDSLLTINKVLNLHTITDPTWHRQLILENLPHYIDEWKRIPNDPMLKEQFLRAEGLPTNKYNYVFDGNWEYSYQLYKYTELFEQYSYMSYGYYCPYSLQLDVYPNITYHTQGGLYQVINSVRLRILFKDEPIQNEQSIKARWQGAYTEKPDAVALVDYSEIVRQNY